MRIDVLRDDGMLATELDALHQRLRATGRLDPQAATPLPEPLRCWRHVADGEFYIYIEDAPAGELAGAIVFNRLIEVNRHYDRILRSPHARLRPPYRGRGLASRLYLEELAAGFCLLSGARQSPGAHALWQSLARDYESGYVRLDGKRLHLLPAQPDAATLDDLQTRRILCGAGWTLKRLLNS